MKKCLKLISYIILWSILICFFIIVLRYLKVKLNGESNTFFIDLYILFGAFYSALAIVPTFLIIDYFIFIPKIKKKIILNSIRFFTILIIILIVAIIEHYYF